MAITYDTSAQDAIALQVWSSHYSELDTWQKDLQDDQTTGATAGGVVGQNLTRANQIGQWFAEAGATSAPAAWQHYLIAASVAGLYQSQRPERASDAYKIAQMALEEAIDTYTNDDLNSASEFDNALSFKAIRWYVLVNCVKRRPRLFPPTQKIDSATRWAFNNFWNRTQWPFRKRSVRLQIDTSGNTVITQGFTTTEAATFSVESLATRELYYSDSGSRGSITCKWADADRMAELRAYYGTETGRPQYFRFEGTGKVVLTTSTTSTDWTSEATSSTLSFQFAPTPDAVYSTRTAVYIATPSLPTSATSTTVFSSLPNEFQPVLRDLVLGKIIKDMSGDGTVFSDTNDEIDRLCQKYTNPGVVDDTQRVRDVNKDEWAISGWQNYLGGAL